MGERNPVLEMVRTVPGTATRIAKACGIGRVAVWQWLKSGTIPARHVLMIEQDLGIPRHLIRPDIYQRGEETDLALVVAEQLKLLLAEFQRVQAQLALLTKEVRSLRKRARGAEPINGLATSRTVKVG